MTLGVHDVTKYGRIKKVPKHTNKKRNNIRLVTLELGYIFL